MGYAGPEGFSFGGYTAQRAEYSSDEAADTEYEPKAYDEFEDSDPLEIVDAKYELDMEKAMLGEGGSGMVRLGREKSSGDMVAIKVIDCSRALGFRQRRFRDFQQEVRTHQSLTDSRYVMPLLDYSSDAVGEPAIDDDDNCYAVLALGKVTLDQWISEQQASNASGWQLEAARIAVHFCHCVTYVHSCGFAHLDITPSNFMLCRDGQWRLIDLGSSRVAMSEDGKDTFLADTVPHTLRYLTPELAAYLATKTSRRLRRQQFPEGGVSGVTGMDWWAVGLVLFEILAHVARDRKPKAKAHGAGTDLAAEISLLQDTIDITKARAAEVAANTDDAEAVEGAADLLFYRAVASMTQEQISAMVRERLGDEFERVIAGIEQQLIQSQTQTQGGGGDDCHDDNVVNNMQGLPLVVGQQVEARHGGKEAWYAGKVSATNDDGTYAILYDDGDAESSVLTHRVRCAAWKPRLQLEEGETVDCYHGGGTRVFPGVISAARSDGTYDVVYDDGDCESEVKRECIEAAYGQPLQVAATELAAAAVVASAAQLQGHGGVGAESESDASEWEWVAWHLLWLLLQVNPDQRSGGKPTHLQPLLLKLDSAIARAAIVSSAATAVEQPVAGSDSNSCSCNSSGSGSGRVGGADKEKGPEDDDGDDELCGDTDEDGPNIGPIDSDSDSDSNSDSLFTVRASSLELVLSELLQRTYCTAAVRMKAQIPFDQPRDAALLMLELLENPSPTSAAVGLAGIRSMRRSGSLKQGASSLPRVSLFSPASLRFSSKCVAPVAMNIMRGVDEGKGTVVTGAEDKEAHAFITHKLRVFCSEPPHDGAQSS